MFPNPAMLWKTGAIFGTIFTLSTWFISLIITAAGLWHLGINFSLNRHYNRGIRRLVVWNHYSVPWNEILCSPWSQTETRNDHGKHTCLGNGIPLYGKRHMALYMFYAVTFGGRCSTGLGFSCYHSILDFRLTSSVFKLLKNYAHYFGQVCGTCDRSRDSSLWRECHGIGGESRTVLDRHLVLVCCSWLYQGSSSWVQRRRWAECWWLQGEIGCKTQRFSQTNLDHTDTFL